MIATILIVLLMTLRIGVHLAQHGKGVDAKFNFPRQVLFFLLWMGMFYAAGLFDKFI